MSFPTDEINLLGAFCGVRDVEALTPACLETFCGKPRVDVMALFGGSILCGGDLFAQAMRDGIAEKYVIVGGAGHTTPALRKIIREVCPDVDTRELSEAEAFDAYLRKRYGLRADLLECRSTNCGNNITNLLSLLKENGIPCGTILLMQDATMQRRMAAGMAKYAPELKVVNFAAYRAEVVERGGRFAFSEAIPGMWTLERYVSLLMGEIPRLTDDENGYGPRGRDFIAHTDVPENVTEAFYRLKRRYPGLVREADPRFA